MYAIAAHLRMRDTGNWRGGGEVVGHSRISLEADRDIPITTYRVAMTEGKIMTERAYTLKIPTKEQWMRKEVHLAADALRCYTDGSRMAGVQSAGAGVYIENTDIRRSYPLGEYATVFQAEVYAILMVATMEETGASRERGIVICSDSQAALKALCSARKNSVLVEECSEALDSLAQTKEVELYQATVVWKEMKEQTNWPDKGANSPC